MSTEHEMLEALTAAVYTTDAQGHITFYNSAAARLWGREPPLGSLWCGSWRIYKPTGELLPHDQCPMAVTLKEGRAVTGVDAVAERPDGTRVPFMPYPTPLFDENGTMTGAINLLVDLSDSHRTEEVRARLAAIVESSDDAIVGKSLAGIVMTWNGGAERIFGYTAEEMVGQHITTIIPPELQTEEDDILERMAKGERVEHYETQRLTKDGGRVYVSLTVSPIRDVRGNVIGASKVARDITERKRAQEVQLLLLNELHHRVKNTLATVDAIARQTLRRSSNHQDFVTSFTGRLQSLGRAHSLLTKATFQQTDVAELLSDQLMMGDQDASRIRTSGPQLLLGAQDSLHLALVFHELGTNARKYGALSGATGAIQVEWTLESGEQKTLKFSWRETGGPRVKAPSSPGFGTTLIRQSIEPYGGAVVITYEKNGLTCDISLPLSEHKDAPWMTAGQQDGSAPVAKRLAKKSSLVGKRILIVEDEPLIAMVAADYLNDGGCQVVGPATTVKAALAIVTTTEIDGALLDGNLTGQSVEEVAAALAHKGTPFAFVTGYGREALPQSFRHAIVVEKPFTEWQLLNAVELLLGEGDSDDNVVDLKQRR